jgi:hypothetical protein
LPNVRVSKWEGSHTSCHKLIIALRTAVENGEGSLDKDTTSHDDLQTIFSVLALANQIYSEALNGRVIHVELWQLNIIA